GLARILEENREWIQRRTGKDLVIRRVLVRDTTKQRDFLPGRETEFTTDLEQFLSASDTDIVVELIGGVDTAHTIITRALKAGKHVVTANKALLAERGPELFTLADAVSRGLYYEAGVAGGIPIVQTLKESLAGNRIKHLIGILNGTANYILSEMTEKGIDFATALSQAQANGYAEADPFLDIQGVDAAHKLTLLIRLAYGQDLPFSRLPVQGISMVEPFDIELARSFGYRIKLLARVKERSGLLQAGVFPFLVSDDHILAKVEGPFNAVLLEGNAVGPIMLYGQGAGDLPTGSAVLSDIMSLVSGRPANNTGFSEPALPKARTLEHELDVTRHYFRFSVVDRPGVLAAIAGVLGERNISIAQVVQRQAPNQKGVPVVFLTHSAQERDVTAALKELNTFSFVINPAVHFKIL
ncbi:MAG: homoserine dehydrogenase, partial [Desulfovibrionales bacterium]